MPEQRLEVDVPDPGDVAAVGDLVVERDDEDARRAAVDERADGLVRAGRVLDQEQEELLVADCDALEAPERGGEALEPGRDVVEPRAERAGQRRRRDGVVDVVEPRQTELDPARAFRRVELEGGPLQPLQVDVPCRDLQRRPGVVAARAAVVAEVADVRGRVGVRRAAADAVLRVGCVLQGRAGHVRVVETEGDAPRVRLADRGELRVVGVEDERRRVRQPGHGFPPALGDELELAVAVELVAEEVAEADRFRPQAPHELGQRGLVHLEQAELGVSGSEQGGGDARDEVRARRVVREPVPRAQDLGRHRGGRRLAVRGGDDRGPRRQPRGETVDRVAVELGEELARDRRAAAGPEPARQSAPTPRAAAISSESGGRGRIGRA